MGARGVNHGKQGLKNTLQSHSTSLHKAEISIPKITAAWLV